MRKSQQTIGTAALIAGLFVWVGCSGGAGSSGPSLGAAGSDVTGGASIVGTGGAIGNGGSSAGLGGKTATESSSVTGGNTSAIGGAANTGGAKATGGSSSTTGGLSATGGAPASGGSSSTGGKSSTAGGTPSTGGTQTNAGSSSIGGTPLTGGTTTSGGSKASGGAPASGGAKVTGGGTSGGNSSYACDGTTTGYNATVIQSGSTWTVTSGGAQKYSGSDTQAALTAAFNSLTSGRTTKQSVLVQGDGDIPATAQFALPSYLILNWCGTLNVSGTASGSDRSPLYARGKTDIDIPNLHMTGSPQYGIFFRGTNNMHLGQIDLRLTSSAGIGIRVDTSGSASTDTTFSTNLTIDYVYGTGMGSHIVETYGVDNIHIGTVEGKAVGECGLLFNRSINATVDLVTCTDCGTGTGYAAFRVANSVGKIGSSFPAGNIHVGKVYARGGGRGIFSVSGCGGLTIDQLDIANTGNTSILLQNTYNTTMAAVSGTVNGGLVQISNDTTNTNNGTFPPSQNVAIKNLVLNGSASVRQDWCTQYGANGCTATNVTGGTVSMCP